jgi:hypothetical protein
MNTIIPEIPADDSKKIALNEKADKLEMGACLHRNE